jgi:hypothetical protein
VRTLAAEFPNDNPALHRGAIWVNVETVGVPIAERADDPTPVVPTVIEPEAVETVVTVVPEPRASGIVAIADAVAEANDADEGLEAEELVVEELPPLDEVAETAAPQAAAAETVANDVAPQESMALPKGPDDPFTALVCVMADVAVGAGSPFVAAALPLLLLDGRLEAGFAEDAIALLRAGGVVDDAGIAPSFVAVTSAWRAILCGTSDDLGACGAAMLDEWAADVLSRLLAALDKKDHLRRQLRDRGVAAFGLIEAA